MVQNRLQVLLPWGSVKQKAYSGLIDLLKSELGKV